MAQLLGWRLPERASAQTRHHTTGDDKIVIPYEWVDRRGELLLTDWHLQANQARQIKTLLRTLEQVDLEVAAGSLIFHIGAGIYYSKINGEVALRPRSCVGPDDATRLTFVERVRKRDRVEEPHKRDSKALERMDEIRADHQRHRRVTMHRQEGRPSHGT